jgi:hypothetical protein
MWESGRPLRFFISFPDAYYGSNAACRPNQQDQQSLAEKMGEVSLGRPRGRTDERRRRPAPNHGPRKVAALTNDVDIMSIIINRYRMEESKVSKRLSIETICPYPSQHPSLCSSKSEFGYRSLENLSVMSDGCH